MELQGYCVHKRPVGILNCVLSQINPVHNLKSYLRSTLISLSHFEYIFRIVLFRYVCSEKCFISHVSNACYMTHQLYSYSGYLPNDITYYGKKEKVVKKVLRFQLN
jgi:hypothetical protein